MSRWQVDLNTLLPALEAQLLANGAVLRPPITDIELDRLTKTLPCQLPAMLERLYRWHNGVAPIIPGYDLLSLEQMREQYLAILAIERDIGLASEEGWPPNYLPILQFDGKEYLALDCSGLKGGAIRHNMNEDPTWDAHYRGLGHFLRVALTAYESGAYRKRRDYLQTDPIGRALAFRRHAEPTELAALEGNWQRINTALEKPKEWNSTWRSPGCNGFRTSATSPL